MSVLLFATFHQHISLVKYLVEEKGLTVHETNKRGSSTVIMATTKEIAEYFISRGVDPTKPNNDYVNALFFAAKDGILDLVKYYHSLGVSMNVRSRLDGSTAMLEAAVEGHTDVVEYLLDNGIAIDEKDDNGVQALAKAATSGHANLCKLLISRGVSINAKDNDGWTPLLLAVSNGQKEVAEVLLAMGASTENAIEHDTALSLACWHGHESIVELLCRNQIHSKQPGIAIYRAIQKDRVNVLDILKTHGADLEQDISWFSESPFFVSVKNGFLRVVQQFITKWGKSVHDTDKKGNSAFLLALQNNQTAIVSWMLHSGRITEEDILNVKVKEKSKMGENAMQANDGPKNTSDETVKSALDIATSYSMKCLLKYFLEWRAIRLIFLASSESQNTSAHHSYSNSCRNDCSCNSGSEFNGFRLSALPPEIFPLIIREYKHLSCGEPTPTTTNTHNLKKKLIAV